MFIISFWIFILDLLPFVFSSKFKNNLSKKSINLNTNFIGYNNTTKLLGKRYISTTTTQALNNVASDIPELAPLVAITLVLLVVLPPICIELRSFISLDAPLMQRIIENPQNFEDDATTLEQFADKKDYIVWWTWLY